MQFYADDYTKYFVEWYDCFMEMHERIVQLRRFRNITQTKLAKTLGVSLKTIARWENGEGIPQTDYLHELASALDTTTDYLLDGMGLGMAVDVVARPPRAETLYTGGKERDEFGLTQTFALLAKRLISENNGLASQLENLSAQWEHLDSNDIRTLADGMSFVIGLVNISLQHKKEGIAREQDE